MPSSPNEITGLPSASHILLSEFFTRVLDGAARNDTAVKQLAIQQRDLDKVAWGDPSGPGWLTHHLELIRDGHKAYPKADVPDDENYEFNQNYFVRAQRWLERHGRSAADAMSEVAQELARRRHRERQHIALERLLYDRASAGKLIIKAREWDYAKNRASSEYKSIPSGFFLRPCRFYYFVLHGRSELVRDTGDGSPNELDDSVFNRNDPPTSYMMAKIARKDAIALRGLFLATASSEIPEDDFARWAGEEHLTQPEVARRNLLRSADVLRLWCQKPIGETGNAMLKSRKAKNESSRAPQSKLKPSFEKIRAAKESEEKETGNSIGLLRPRERLKRLTDRMKSMGLKPAEIPHERTFREYFNNGPGKSEKSG